MAKSVFISHSSKDVVAAQSICAFMERHGAACWVAARDIQPGREYPEQIMGAIEACDVVVLVLSSHSNVSQHVWREVERAVSKGKPVYPVRIEQVAPSKALEYFVQAHQFLDAFVPPLEQRLVRLEEAISGPLAPATPLRPADPKAVQGVVTGNRVNLRTGPTVVARRLASLVQGDEVRILERLDVPDSRECQLKDDYVFTPRSGDPYRLLAGRAFVVSGENDENFRVEIARREGNDVGYIPKSILVSLDPATWYRVESRHGEGWVYGRYVRVF